MSEMFPIKSIVTRWIVNREKEMSKMAKADRKTVKFTYTDGKEVTRGSGGVFNLRAPISTVIAPKGRLRVKLGVKCDKPVHVFEARGVRERGLKLPDGIWACVDADTELEVELENRSDAPQPVELGDTLARCFVIDNADVEVVK